MDYFLLASISRWTRRMFAFLTAEGAVVRGDKGGVDSRGDRRRMVESAELPSDCIRDGANGFGSCFTG